MCIRVAVAVIINQQDQILISKRSPEQHQGNKWEFPGGKVEEGESSHQALCREIREELGIELASATRITDVIHHYQDEKHGSKKVFLDVFEVRSWSGEPEGREGQPLCWVEKHELNNYDFPDANTEILRLLTH